MTTDVRICHKRLSSFPFFTRSTLKIIIGTHAVPVIRKQIYLLFFFSGAEQYFGYFILLVAHQHQAIFLRSISGPRLEVVGTWRVSISWKTELAMFPRLRARPSAAVSFRLVARGRPVDHRGRRVERKPP